MARVPFVRAPITTPMFGGGKFGDMDMSWVQWFKQRFFGGQLQYLEGSHGELVATDPATVTEGSVFFDTTRGVWYVARGLHWDYYSGIHSCAQVDLPADLGLHDAGFLANVWDYSHLLQWTGAGWTWGPGEGGSGYIVGFVDAPAIPGWHLCDGATVSKLGPTGTLVNVLLPDYTTAAYIKFGITCVPGPTAPSGLSAAVSAGTPAGTVTQTSPITTGLPSLTGTALAGAGSNTATDLHVHDVAVDVNPIFAGAALAVHDHGPGTLELRRSQLWAFYRQ